jgi:streptogramin lyase
MKTPVKLFVLFLLFVFCTPCEGQNKSELPTITTKSTIKEVISFNGPTSSVRTIRQDRKGNIWLASVEGIIRYNGKSFTTITGKLSSNRFFSVVEDRKGNFWFGNYGSGGYCYDGKSFRHFTTNQGLVNNWITDVYEDKTGNIWFGSDVGASRYDGKSFRNYIMNRDTVIEDRTGKSFSDAKSGSNGAHPIIEDKRGNLWFGTNGNTFMYDGKTFRVVLNKNGDPLTNIWSIIEDKMGNVWLGGIGALWRYNGSTFTKFSSNTVRYLCEDKKGNIWASGMSANKIWALSRYDAKSLPGKKPTVIEIAQSKNLFGLLAANDGSIWFGSFDGVYRYDGKTITDFKNTSGKQ